MNIQVFFVFFVLFFCINSTSEQIPELFELSIIHLNDFHARFEEVNKYGSPCKDTDCIGGFSRVYTAVHELLQSRPNAIFLNAGDNFQGTLWYFFYKWNVTLHFLNKLATDAYTLGNDEFDDKIAGLAPFITGLNAPTVVANINDTFEPEFQGLCQKSTVLVRGGRNIGIIGVMPNNSNELSATENLIFTDEVEAINKEAERLVNEQNTTIIIVLSHCGYEADIEIAKKVGPHVNVIVGGHTHTLLYSGTPPSGDTASGPYPTVVDRNGRKVLVVQADANTRYLGNLTVWYNVIGDVVHWEGNPVYLGPNVQQDPDINDEINVWKEAVDAQGNRVIGSTNVELSNSDCHSGECNLGDFFADAMVHYYVSKAEPNAWTYAAVAIINSGGIRDSLYPGNITYADLISTSPFKNTIDVVELTGAVIREILEYAVIAMSSPNWRDHLVQIGGISVFFDLTKPEYNRVISLEIACRECPTPVLQPYEPNSTYRVALLSFLAIGGDGFTMISDNLRNHQTGPVDLEVFESYIRNMTPITTAVDGRMNFV